VVDLVICILVHSVFGLCVLSFCIFSFMYIYSHFVMVLTCLLLSPSDKGITVIIIIYIINQSVQFFQISLHPFNNDIIFFLQLFPSFQSYSINPCFPISLLTPFHPGQFRCNFFYSSWWTPFHDFFW
jgi:hypothetical protein